MALRFPPILPSRSMASWHADAEQRGIAFRLILHVHLSEARTKAVDFGLGGGDRAPVHPDGVGENPRKRVLGEVQPSPTCMHAVFPPIGPTNAPMIQYFPDTSPRLSTHPGFYAKQPTEVYPSLFSSREFFSRMRIESGAVRPSVTVCMFCPERFRSFEGDSGN